MRTPRYMIDSDSNVYGVNAGVLKPYLGVKGKYLQVTLGNSDVKYVHRLVAETFVPNPESKPIVAHGDGNGLNSPAWNLRWATHVENMADKKLHGTHLQGERAGNAKLSDADVLQIRELKEQGCRVDEIAKDYGVSRWTVYDACNTKRRKLADV